MELIDRKALRNAGYEVYTKYCRNNVARDAMNELETLIKTAPTVDAVPVVHSEWEKFYHPSGTHGIRCKNCKEQNGRKTYYCPNCGAKMDEVRND